MKWVGVVLMSVVKGAFLALLFSAMFPSVAGTVLVVVASIGAVLVFDTLFRLVRAASTIEVRRSVLPD